MESASTDDSETEQNHNGFFLQQQNAPRPLSHARFVTPQKFLLRKPKEQQSQKCKVTSRLAGAKEAGAL